MWRADTQFWTHQTKILWKWQMHFHELYIYIYIYIYIYTMWRTDAFRAHQTNILCNTHAFLTHHIYIYHATDRCAYSFEHTRQRYYGTHRRMYSFEHTRKRHLWRTDAFWVHQKDILCDGQMHVQFWTHHTNILYDGHMHFEHTIRTYCLTDRRTQILQQPR